MHAETRWISVGFLFALSLARDAHAQHTTLPTSLVTRVSVDSAGAESNGHSELWGNFELSSDGRFIAFASYATNLVLGDTNNVPDVFVHDRLTGDTTRLSVNSTGQQGNGWSYLPSISANGRYIAFTSAASNLAPGDSNNTWDVFVKDRITGATLLASVDSSGGHANDSSDQASLSADGRMVAYYSAATNLVSADTNGSFDIFVHDLITGTTVRVSVDSAGVQGNNNSYSSSISADGQHVAYYSTASNLVSNDTNGVGDVFVRDLTTNQTLLITVDSYGTQARSGGDFPSISADGQFVAFESDDRHLVPSDTNKARDVFVRDRVAGVTTRVSLSSDGSEGDRDSEFPTISADGRLVAFSSLADTLSPADSLHGRHAFVHDRLSRQTTLVSKSITTHHVDGDDAGRPSISADGRYVAFDSPLPTMVPNDTNMSKDVFIRGPELTLDVDPSAVVTGQTVTLTTYKSATGHPASLWVVSVNSLPAALLVHAGYFDDDGTFIVSGVVPPGLTGLTLGFRGYGDHNGGTPQWSNIVAVLFR